MSVQRLKDAGVVDDGFAQLSMLRNDRSPRPAGPVGALVDFRVADAGRRYRD
jgi:hypothetical protein